MKKYFLFFAVLSGAALFCAAPAAARPRGRANIRNALKSMYTPDYLALKERLIAQFRDVKPGKFAEFVKGEVKDLRTDKKVLALTFDACGGRHGGYNSRLIEYLRKEKIPATLFVTGLWINKHPGIFKALAVDPLFEIENHGLMHRIVSINGRSKYGVAATRDLGDVVDEIELNARKIAAITGRRPLFFRPAAAYADAASVRVARSLGIKVVTYDILSGDSRPRAPAKIIRDNLVKHARPGAIIIMHFNHPGWNEEEALRQAVPLLLAKGFSFVKLQVLPPKFIGVP